MNAKITKANELATMCGWVYRQYVAGGRSVDLDLMMGDYLKGKKAILRDGTIITVRSVANAGFNGMQISGVTADGTHRIDFWK